MRQVLRATGADQPRVAVRRRYCALPLRHPPQPGRRGSEEFREGRRGRDLLLTYELRMDIYNLESILTSGVANNCRMHGTSGP